MWSWLSGHFKPFFRIIDSAYFNFLRQNTLVFDFFARKKIESYCIFETSLFFITSACLQPGLDTAQLRRYDFSDSSKCLVARGSPRETVRAR